MTTKQVVKFKRLPRERYISNHELESTLQHASDFIKQYVTLKLLTVFRKGELLAIRLPETDDNGATINRNKAANQQYINGVIL